MFCKKGAFENFAKFTGEHLSKSLFFNKVAGLRSAASLRKRLWHRCFSVTFLRFSRTAFFIEHLGWLLLFYPELIFLLFHLTLFAEGFHLIFIFSPVILSYSYLVKSQTILFCFGLQY